MKIKRNDTVVAISGVDAGKTGRVLQVLPGNSRVIVEGLNLCRKTLRKTQENPQGGFSDKEAPIHLSNVQLYCPETKKGVRVSNDRSSGKLVRKSKKSDHAFD